MEELPTVLRQQPLGAEIGVERLSDQTMRQIGSVLDKADRSLCEVNVDLCKALCRQGFKEPLLAVGCPRTHPLLRTHATDGIWGTAFQGGPLAVCWQVPDKFIVWHEVLHLLGADECYKESTHEQTCERPNCIMQYVPTSASVGEWPFLCLTVMERLRRCLQIQLGVRPDGQQRSR